MLPLKPLSSPALEQNRDMAALQRRWSDGGRSQTWSRQMALERQPSDAITRPLSFLIRYYSNLLLFFLLPINPTDALHPSTTTTAAATAVTFLRNAQMPESATRTKVQRREKEQRRLPTDKYIFFCARITNE